jgi:hypothetical protein
MSVTNSLDSIMNEFRIGDKKSNIMQLNMNEYFPNNPTIRIASLLEQSNNLSNKTYRLNFDPIQEIVLKKMIGDDMLNKRLIIEEHDFFKGIFLLNYYCSVIAKSYDVVDSLYSYAKQLERIDKSKDPVMKDVIEYVLQDSLKKSIFVGKYVERGTNSAYNSMKQNINLSGVQFITVSPIYSGAAKIIEDTLTNLESSVLNIESRADLNALIFTDALYPYIQNDSNFNKVTNLLEKKDFLHASITALQIASKNYYTEHIDTKLNTHNTTNDGNNLEDDLRSSRTDSRGMYNEKGLEDYLRSSRAYSRGGYNAY